MKRNGKEKHAKAKLGKGKILVVVSVLFCFLVGGAGAGLVLYNNYMIEKMTAAVSEYDNIIYPGVSVNGIDMSLKTAEEAKQILNSTFQEPILGKKMTLRNGQTEYVIEYTKFNPMYDIDNVVQEAFDYGKKLDLRDKYDLINNAPRKEYSLTFSVDPSYAEEFAKELEGKINVPTINATYTFSNGAFNVSPDQTGYSLKTEELINLIKQNIKEDINDNAVIELPIEELKPTITADAINSVNTIIGSSSTGYPNSSEDRETNIKICTEALTNVMLMPGQSFSFNELVGETSPEKGYKEGGVYIGNKLEMGYGGGICQVSSTLYNAISKAGIIPTQRTNHSMPVGYLPLGLDATIAYPYLDLVFVNPFDYPIYIEGVNADSKLTFNIYSNGAATNGLTYELTSEVIETIQPKSSTVEDPNLPEGQTVQDVKPSIGYKVKVYRKTLQNGVEINNEYMYTDTYKVVDEVIKVGTKKG